MHCGQVFFAPTGFDDEVAITTREAVTQDSFKANWQDLKTGRLLITGNADEPGSKFAFTRVFVQEYCKNMPNTIVYLSACRSAYNKSMSNAFLAGGASVVYGYSNYVHVTFATEQGTGLFNRLLGGDTTETAYRHVAESVALYLFWDNAGLDSGTVINGTRHYIRKELSLTVRPYTVRDIGILNDASGRCVPTDINEHGVVVGYSDFGHIASPSHYHAWMWVDPYEGIKDLTLLPNQTSDYSLRSAASSINDSNQVVGHTGPYPASLPSACLWEGSEVVYLDSEMSELEVKGTPQTFMANGASGINNSGIIIGWGEYYGRGTINDDDYLPGGKFGFKYNRPAESGFRLSTFWDPKVYPSVESTTTAINSAGVVLGSTSYVLDFPTRFFVPYTCKVEEDVLVPLDVLSQNTNRVNSINDQLEVIGTHENMPAYWPKGSARSILALLPDYEWGAAVDINNRGTIIGFCIDEATIGSDTVTPVIWPAPSQTPIDLNCLIQAESGWKIIAVTAINDRGQIAGYGEKEGSDDQFRAFVLNPWNAE